MFGVNKHSYIRIVLSSRDALFRTISSANHRDVDIKAYHLQTDQNDVSLRTSNMFYILTGKKKNATSRICDKLLWEKNDSS